MNINKNINKKIVISAVSVTLIIISILFGLKIVSNDDISINDNTNESKSTDVKENNSTQSDSNLTPEEALSNLEGKFENKDLPHNLKLTIISPEGDTIMPRQARMYNALVEGNGKYENPVNCHWDFYLNENNEEVLYKQMDNRSVLSQESQEICGFTSTFMESRGELRIVLTATIYSFPDKELEKITAERNYTVK